MTQQCDLSFQQRNLFQQGYQTYTPAELRQIDWGLRFTPTVCSLIALYGLITQNPYLLFAVAVLGMLAFFFPAGHPMDMIYNNAVRKLFDAVKLPPNPFQRRLACFAAGIMNTIAGISFLAHMPTAAYVVGGMLLALQAIVIFTHFCTLSWMYEGLMRAIGKWDVPIDDNKAQELIKGGAVLVDVRGRDEFDTGHLYSAVNLPLEEIEKYADKLKDQTVLLYCRSGNRSQIARKRLNNVGVKNVYDIGGIGRAKMLLAQT